MTPAEAALRELEAQFALIGRRLRRSVTERAAAIDPSLGVLGYVVLDYTRRNGPCRQADMVAALGTEKGAVSRTVRQLIDLGLVESRPDPHDRRAQQVAITEKGSARLEEVIAQRRQFFAEKMRDWPTGELEELAAMLARFNAVFDETDS